MTEDVQGKISGPITGTGRVVGDHTRKGPRGRGAMRDVVLSIDPRIDLTKPIYEQVLALEKADKESAGNS